MSNCETSNQSCNAPQHPNVDACPVEKSIGDACCPVEQSVSMWNKSFFQAMRETQVDILKEKIKKAWGPVMDKEGDAIVEAMGVHWQSLLAQAKAQAHLKDNIKKIFESLK